MLQYEDRWDWHLLTNYYKSEEKKKESGTLFTPNWNRSLTSKHDITQFQYDTSIKCGAGSSVAFPLSRPRGVAWVALSDMTALCLGFGRDWVVMGGQCWGALCYPRGFIWWAGIGFICSVYRFVFATRAPHSSFELDFFHFLTSSEKRNSIEHSLIPSAPAFGHLFLFWSELWGRIVLVSN